MNQELELYKLLMPGDCDAGYVSEFGWIKDEFVLWVSKWFWAEFTEEFIKIFGSSVFGDGGFTANVQEEYICFDLVSVVSDIDLEKLFPKEEFQH